MAEEQTQKSGLTFSNEVLEKIAGIAAGEVAGVAAMSGGVVEGIAARLGRKNLTKGVSVEFAEQEVTVSLKIIVEYGKSIPDIYAMVEDRVRNAIETMTGMHVVGVSVFVEDIFFPGEVAEARKEAAK
jgi:uncharacterized alkaline shock family protein YloU